MPTHNRHLFYFEPFTLDVLRRKLFKKGVEVELGGKAFEVLLHLVENHGRTLSRKDLFDLAWPGVEVTDKNLTIQIGNIRKAIGEGYIERVHNGFCFVGEVEEDRQEIQESPNQLSIGSRRDVLITTGAGADPSNPPWVGPVSYPIGRAPDFFGRDKEIEDLVRLLSEPTSDKRAIFLHSPSGAGKSSLIEAGLRHQFLENSAYELFPTVRIGVPCSELPPKQNPFTHAVIASTKDATSKFSEGAITLNRYLSNRRHKTKNTVIIIDQAEELLRVDTERGRYLKPFFIELRDALYTDRSLRVLFAFRDESLAEFQRVSKEISNFSTWYSLTKLRIEEARQVIQIPAATHGVEFDPEDLLQRLVLALCDYTGDFVEPMQLQLVCIALWRALIPGATKVTWDVLRGAVNDQSRAAELLPAELVGFFVKSVLQVFCQRAIERTVEYAGTRKFHFPPSLIDLGCGQFIKDRRTRVLIPQGDSWTGTLPNVVVDGLVNEQLLRVEQLRQGPAYELAHDTLIDPILERVDAIDDESLRTAFSAMLKEIENTDRARTEGFDENLIAQKCCLIFVSEDGGERSVSLQSLNNTGLPEWFFDEMEQRGILRRESHHDHDVYQLSHWRLAKVLYQNRSHLLVTDRIFQTRKLLGSYLEQCRAPGASMESWYPKVDELLKHIKEDLGTAVLSPDEATFVLRANLASQRPIETFTIQLFQNSSTLTANVLREATKYESSIVRKNAAAALGMFAIDDRENLLLDLALNDTEVVAKKAAEVLANIEGLEIWERLFLLLDQPTTRSSAIRVIAWMFDAIPSVRLVEVETRLRRLSWFTRLRVRLALTALRLTRDRNRMIVAWVIGLATTTLFTVPPRAILATFNLTITQLSPLGFFEGIFNGFAGAITWSVFIGGSLFLWWYLFEGRQPWQGRASWLVGALAGTVGGIANTFALVNVYLPKSLADMRWITTEHSSLIETMTVSHLAYAMPLSGLFVGLGVSQSARKLLPWAAKLELLRRQSEHSELIRLLGTSSVKAFKISWLIFLPTLAAGVILHSLLPPEVVKSIGPAKLAGEAISVSFGGVGLVVGILYGQLVLRMGLQNISGNEEKF